MTNEKAVKQIKENCYFASISERTKQALNKAIQALEQQPSEDCISREKAKQFLYERIDRLNDDELYDIFSRIIDDMYNELPSIKPERAKGKWIRVVDKAGHWVWECDCKWQQRFATNYCPNCGAEMSGGADE